MFKFSFYKKPVLRFLKIYNNISMKSDKIICTFMVFENFPF